MVKQQQPEPTTNLRVVVAYSLRQVCALILASTLALILLYQIPSSARSYIGNTSIKGAVAVGDDARRSASGPSSSQDRTSDRPPRRPNILIITTDQQRYDTLSIVQKQLSHYRNKLQIQTPHLDRLASRGTLFWNAYCQSPSCAPSRSSLRTGCTTARTGVRGNKLLHKLANRRKTRRQLERLWTYDQILVEQLGYVAESYGKKHLPKTMLYQHEAKQAAEDFQQQQQPQKAVLQYDNYNFETLDANLTQAEWQDLYPRHLAYLANRDNLRTEPFAATEQRNDFSGFPYTPTALDARFGQVKLGSVNVNSQARTFGKDSLSSNYTATALIGQMAIAALQRLSRNHEQQRPFCLTVSFHSPHPPFVATPDYLSQYWDRRSSLYLAKRDVTRRQNSPYHNNKLRITEQMETPKLLAEWTAIYYALITEVDTWVGHILDTLDDLQLTENTLVVFTSDHGEMLGAHGLSGKNNFYEEASRVPLILSYPGVVAANETYHGMANHIDVLATILDYVDAREFDKSDGKSLRPALEQASYNKDFDESVAISESVNMKKDMPNYMVRKGPFKLMIAKTADATTMDMFVNVEDDPFETNNWIASMKTPQSIDTRAPGESTKTVVDHADALSGRQIGKIEHLKALLVEWMKRVDGNHGFLSKPVDGGPNEIEGVIARQTWPTVDYWVSDDRIEFGLPVLVGDQYIRNEYIYVGRTNPGELRLTDISVEGRDAGYFTVSEATATIQSGEDRRLRISFQSVKCFTSVDARIVIRHDAGPDMQIEISQI